MEQILTELNKEVQLGEAEKVKKLIQKALDQGIAAMDILEKGLRAAMEEVGAKFEALEIFLPEMMSAADAMKEGVEVLQPHLGSGSGEGQRGSILLGTVEGDIHEIGKTLVGTMLTANGFKVVDIGVDKSTSDFISAIKEVDADIVGASALLTTTMVKQNELIKALVAAGIRGDVKVMIGGAPVTKEYADEIGADGYAEDAISAVDMAFRLMDAPAS